ncbi:MAG: parB,1 [Gammaproteobacteria bacterium]|jgi:ParB family chromosome partitioning protein|nr:parB,1 [Gammaproteobacteria bacterium]
MSALELKGFKGLQSLDTLLADTKSEEFIKENIFELPIDKLVSGKYQPRTDFNNVAINELALSIKSQGILMPLIVRRTELEKFEIIAGERRWQAAKIAGLQIVPAIIREISDETAVAFGLIENIQREGLNPIDEAMAFIRLREEFAMTHEEIAERVGRSRSSVTNLMRLISLPDNIRELLRVGKIEMGHARALLSLDEGRQHQLADDIVSKNLSVRETEKLVQKEKLPIQTAVVTKRKHDEQIIHWEKYLSEKISSKVKISLNDKGEGKIVISISSPEEIEWLVNQFTTEC